MTEEPGAFTVAIDGPAASGKSTTALRVAEALGALHLNSGQLYRAITWAALKEGWIDEENFAARLAELPISLVEGESGFEVEVGGRRPRDALSAPDVVGRVSEVSARSCVRQRVTKALREAARDRRVVSDGRDVGTTVFPDAGLKVFLTASPVERARRRLLDQGKEVTDRALKLETAALVARDRADSTRELSPLRRAEDAVEIDTTRLSPEEVVTRIVELARHRRLG
jgi:cytidylate kinase